MANNWTYCIYDPDTREAKWGRSINPFERVKAFRSEHPNCELVLVLPDHSVEFELHDKFADKRQHGEWFFVDEEMMEFIEKAKLWTPAELSFPEAEVDSQLPLEILSTTPPEENLEERKISPKADVYVGAFLIAASSLMLFLTFIALLMNNWTLDLNTGRWLLSYGPGLGIGIYVIRRGVKQLSEK